MEACVATLSHVFALSRQSAQQWLAPAVLSTGQGSSRALGERFGLQQQHLREQVGHVYVYVPSG